MSERDRDRELGQIRAAYARYRDERRERLWDTSNPGYARMLADRDAALADLLSRSLPPTNGRVLDLGCGDGRLALVAREANLTAQGWVGVDFDPIAVAKASGAFPWATFVEASADRLAFAAGSFDVVVASTLFSSFPSHAFEDAVAGELTRVLVPGGWLIWYDLRYDNPRNSNVHGIDADALARLFPAWPSELRSITLLPPVARRLGWLTPAIYPVLESFPPLRSHLVGRLRRPTTS